MPLSVADLAADLQAAFTSEAEDAAEASGFVRRKRLLDGPAFAQTVSFGWLANPDAALDELADFAWHLGRPVTPQALDQRFTPEAADSLSRLPRAALQRTVACDPPAAALLGRFAGVYVRDASTVALPRALAAAFPGQGHNGPARPCASVKPHLGLDVSAGALEALTLQPGHTSDRACVGVEAPLPEGAILLEDLGYFGLRRLAHYDGQGVYLLSRAPTRLLVRRRGGVRRPLADFLSRLGTDRFDGPVTLGRRRNPWPCRMIAVRVPDAAAKARRGRAERDARNLGREVSAAKRELCSWTALLTNAPGSLLSAQEALALRRARWQVELLFKALKSEGEVDESRGRKPSRVPCELLAKLLGRVARHWVSLLAGGPLEVSAVKASRRIRRKAARLAGALRDVAALAALLGELRRRLGRARHRPGGRPRRPTTLAVLTDPERFGFWVPEAPADEQAATAVPSRRTA